MGTFRSSWFDAYAPLASAHRQELPVHRSTAPTLLCVPQPHDAGMDGADVVKVREHGVNSYQEVLDAASLRGKFEQFLAHVFHIEPPRELLSVITSATLLPACVDDGDVYTAIRDTLAARKCQAWCKGRAMVRQLAQLGAQKTDLTLQTSRICHALGLVGALQDMVSVGDAGKVVQNIRRRLNMRGRTWVVHDQQRGLLDAVERGSPFSVGRFVPIDYAKPTLSGVPSASADLLTLNQGLHHFPQHTLVPFLAEVRRVLRPGGVFLLREHDAVPELIPILDLAHSVFNAVVTDTTEAEERAEIRAFRPVAAWRDIVTAAGFDDPMVADADEKDPTEDIMMAFVRPMDGGNVGAGAGAGAGVGAGAASAAATAAEGTTRTTAAGTVADNPSNTTAADLRAVSDLMSLTRHPSEGFYRLPEWIIVHVLASLSRSLNHTPWFRYPFLSSLAMYFGVLAAELNYVRRRYGLSYAVFSYGFTMSCVTATFLTFVFLQLAVLALPLWLLYGGDTTPEELEELVLRAPSDRRWATSRDFSVVGHKQRGRYTVSVLHVRRHAAYARTLATLAQDPAVELLRVSGHADVTHLRCSVAGPAGVLALRSHADVDVLKVYRVEGDATAAAVTVATPRLLPFLRWAAADAAVTVEQVFDGVSAEG